MDFETAFISLLGTILLIMLLICLVNILFIISIYKTARRIPEQYHRFPIWFCWLMFIPVVGIVFMWLILPFSLPAALKDYAPDNYLVQRKARTLFGVGLAYVITLTLSMLFHLIGIATLVLCIIYWVKVVEVRQYLNNRIINLQTTA